MTLYLWALLLVQLGHIGLDVLLYLQRKRTRALQVQVQRERCAVLPQVAVLDATDVHEVLQAELRSVGIQRRGDLSC